MNTKFDLYTISRIRYDEGGLGSVIEYLLGGSDKMLVPLPELKALNSRILGERRALPHSSVVLNCELDAVQSYLLAVIEVRESLAAAGVELA